MIRTRSKNVRTKLTSTDGTNKATQTVDIDTVAEIARLQEQVRLLQLENNVLRQHMPMSNKPDHANTYRPLRVEAQEKPQANEITCKCKGKCCTKRCGCVRENNKCTALCKCSVTICQNQELKDQDEESDQENKENIIMNGMETPKKQEEEKMTQNKIAIKTKDMDLASDKVTNDVEEQFNPMKPRHQLSRTPPTKNRIFVNEMSHLNEPIINNKQKSQSPESPQILALSFNVKTDYSDAEKEIDWEQHRAQLIPCKKCKRTFMPHRIQKHEACCKKI